MKKIMMTLAAVLCCAMTTVVNAQEAESPIKKGERLAKAADDAPQDWKKQYDAAEFYLNESKGTPNTILAEKYVTRALEIAKGQTVKRDTILGKSLELMSAIGMYNKNVDQMIGYYDQAIRAYVDELGYQNAAIPPRIAFLASLKWMLHSSGAYAYGDADHTEVCLITQTKGVTFLIEVYIPDEFGWFAHCDVSLFIHQHKTVLKV